MKTNEVHINSVIALRDLETKIATVERLIEKGRGVKVFIKQKGRQATHPEIALDVVNKMKEALAEKAKLGGTPVYSGPVFSLYLVPK